MFDNETSMSLTAQIFGLSTFVSSYQIYNVDKRLQEDNLQHLALFSEYGRLAVGQGSKVIITLTTTSILHFYIKQYRDVNVILNDRKC